MALIACRECENQISDKAVSCPRCGAVLGGPRRPRRRGLWALFALGLIACAFGVLMFTAGRSLAADHRHREALNGDLERMGSCATYQCLDDLAEKTGQLPADGSDPNGQAQTLIGLTLIPVGGITASYSLIALAVSRGVRSVEHL